MSDRTPEPVQDAANKLIGALALHEDTRDTIESALHDLWDAAHEHATPADLDSLRQLAQLIRDDAHALATGAALTRVAPATRIRDKADQILTALNQATPGDQPDWFCAHHGEMGDDTDPEPWCHGCVDAGVTTAPARSAER